jgi:hypothetical protein
MILDCAGRMSRTALMNFFTQVALRATKLYKVGRDAVACNGLSNIQNSAQVKHVPEDYRFMAVAVRHGFCLRHSFDNRKSVEG